MLWAKQLEKIERKFRISYKMLFLVQYQYQLLFINDNYETYHKGLEKQEDLKASFVLQGVTPLLHVAQWDSRAPPHHTLPAFLNLNGTKLSSVICNEKL